MCVCSHKWKIHSVAWVMPQGWGLGLLGVKKLSVGIRDEAPHQLRFLV